MGRIILVDDNPTTLKRWEYLLAPLGHEVLSFSGAEPALQVLRVHPSSLVVLDLAMPIHSGYDLMSSLKSASIAAPILVVSGKNNQADISKALSLGAVDYVLKPFDDDIFLAKVDRILASPLNQAQFKSSFAEAVYPQACVFAVQVPSLVISEMGFTFQTQVQLTKGSYIQFQATCFAEMGIKDNRFRVTSTSENPPGQEYRYTSFVSFVGLSLSQLRDVRVWVRENQMKSKRVI